jgi:hypothetical protein
VKRLVVGLLVTLAISLAALPGAHGQRVTVGELVAQGWTTTQIARSPDFPGWMAALSDEEYLAFLRDLIALAQEQGFSIATLQALRQQGVPANQTCRITRNVLLDSGINPFNPGNPYAVMVQRQAGCSG